MPTPAAEDNPHSEADDIALAIDAFWFALLPHKHFLPRPVYECELDRFSDCFVSDEHGGVITPNFVIVYRTAHRFVRFATHVSRPDQLPFTDEECVAHLRSIGVTL